LTWRHKRNFKIKVRYTSTFKTDEQLASSLEGFDGESKFPISEVKAAPASFWSSSFPTLKIDSFEDMISNYDLYVAVTFL
jgi:hypothetical protein